MKTKGISLHIGLNEVDPAHYDGWKGELNAGEADAYVYQGIADKCGYKSKLMLSKAATVKNIESYFTQAIKELKSGDTFFLSYSGHGGSVMDINDDEPDGMDETWCLYDRQFLDDELYRWFSKFNEGVKILIFSDSCHSGSIAKMELKSDKEKAADKNTGNLKSRLAPMDVLIKTYESNKKEYNDVQKGAVIKKEDIPAFVLQFGACQDPEVSYEAFGNGLFTAKLKRVLEGKTSSYSDLFEKIKKGFRADQHPNLFHYGNSKYNFVDDIPFVLGNKAKDVIFFEPDTEKSPIQSKSELIVEFYDGTRNTKTKSRGATAKNLPKNAIVPSSQQDRFEITGTTAENPWDEAYSLVRERSDIRFAEPNINSPYLKIDSKRSDGKNEYLKNWPKPEQNEAEFTWHLDELHSQLKKASDAVIAKKPNATIRIGHIDTGYREHVSNPKNLMKDFGVSFVKDEFGKNKGIDKFHSGSIAEQDGHGTATLALLAGGEVPADKDYPASKAVIGAAPFAEVIPIRICETVFNSFSANDVARGIDYAVDYGCEVITMSMAGYPTKRVAEAVNRAYLNGVVVVTAAGNNFTSGIGQLAPKAILYPARFDRVIAATGSCYNGEPYDLNANSWYQSRTAGGEQMQGNWGPASAMKTALAAYTPNLAWANFDDGLSFLRSGGGTSSATPQIAAAAALWIAHNRDKIVAAGIDKNWKKVEAVRTALFSTANKSYPAYRQYFGNGILRAYDALDAFDFAKVHQLRPSEKAKVGFLGLVDFFSGWFRSKAQEKNTLHTDNTEFDGIKEMISLELLQLIHTDPTLHAYAEVLDLEADDTTGYFADATTRKAFMEKVKASPYASNFIKSCMESAE
ncbi:MAG: caspase family protein [Flavobacterium sp.]